MSDVCKFLQYYTRMGQKNVFFEIHFLKILVGIFHYDILYIVSYNKNSYPLKSRDL
jgi:hypothetical protein